MRKLLTFFLTLALGIASEAQPTYYNHAATTGGTTNIFPFNANPVPGKKVQFVIAAGEFNQPTPAPAGNNITTLWFWANGAGTATYTNLTIRMATVSTTTFIATGAWYAGPMTTVLAQNTAVMPTGANTWVGIPLTTPFPYDPTMNIIIEVFHCGYTGTGFSLRQLSYGAAPNFRRQYSDAASVCGATVLPTGGDLNLPGIGITTVSASCTPNTTSNGTATINTSGTVVPISACNFAGDYSTINGAVNGQTLSFTSSVATDFITVRSGTPGGPILASGTTPLVFANTFTGTVYAHWNTPGCGTQNTCRATTVQCTSCGAPPCTVTLTSATGTNSQTVCNGSAIIPITYATTVATGATFSGLPPGVTGNWAGNVVTINGTPTANGVFNYTVTLVGCTASTTATGSITVSAGGSPMSIVANPGTTLCAGDPALLTAMNSSGPPVPATVAVTGFLNNNANAVIAFNFRNNNASAVTITGIESICSTAGLKDVSALYKASAINGLPGTLDAANGWNQFGSAVITGIANTTTTTTQPFMTGLSLVVPPGATYGIVVQAVNQGTTTAAQRYSTIAAGVYTFSAAGCDIITGTNIGYGGVAIPGAPTFALRGFMGKINVLSGGTLTPITTGTFLWSPATGLSSTTINPVAASPMVTTTYTVTHNNGGGCVRTANITLTVNQLPTVTAQPVNTAVCSGLPATFTVGGTGAGLSYQWQISTTGAGGPWVDLTNTAPYSGVTTATLTINPTTLAMTGYRYRCNLGGICPPLAASNSAILTVNTLPTIAVSPTGPLCGGVAGTNGTALTASGANSYVWSPVTGLYTNATASTPYTGTNLATVYAAPTVLTTYVVTGTATGTGCSNTASVIVNYTPPAPTVVPASVTMCLGDPAVKLKSSSSQQFTASFTSGAVNGTISQGPNIPPVPTSYPPDVTSNITVSGIPAGATIANVRARFNVTHAYVSDLVIALKAPNGQIINLCALANFANPAGANFVNTTFSSASSTAITPPYTGTYKADLAGATFNALGFTFPGGPVGYVPTSTVWSSLYSTPNGVWSVGVYDAGAPDGGTFNNWALDIDYIVGVPATPAVWTPIAGLFSDANATTAYVAGTAVDSVWVRPTPSGVYNYQATVKSIDVSGTITLPAHAATFTGNVRGYWFTAPSSFTMSSLFVPTDASTGTQNIAVLRFNPPTPPPAFPAVTNAFTTLFLTQNNASATPIPVNIPINAGDVIAIMGNRGNINSYGPVGPSVTTINGVPVTLTRMGMQFLLATTAPQDVWQEPAGAITRVFFSYGLPVSQCTSPARNIVVTVNQPLTVNNQSADQAICTDKVATFSVAVSGTGPYTYQWQVSTNGGGSYNNVANGGVYNGATTTTLTITAPPVTMSGYIYRCNITGAAPCAAITSVPKTLTVYPLPTTVITANPAKLLPGMRIPITSSVSPNAANPNGGYQWLRDGTAVTSTSTGVVSGVGTGSLTIDVDGIGNYQLRVTDVNNCTNVSNILSITDSVSGKCFIYPNPNSGKFQVRYYSALNNVLPRAVSVFDAKGDRVLTQSYAIGRPYDRMEVDLRKNGKGLYWVEVIDVNGNRITMCRVVVQ